MAVGSVAAIADSSRRSRSRADMVMRRLLFVPAGPATVGDGPAQRMFSVSILISAGRCLLSYVVFPILTPVLGVATGVGPAVGLPIAVLALVFDVIGIRRFWVADHRWRWGMTLIYAAVMGLVSALLVGDIVDLVS
jgi:hypothetical protein